jgi:predicted nucleic acid-binding protein
MRVFIDSSAFISLFDKRDQMHEEVMSKFQMYQQMGALFMISDYILDELYTWMIKRINQREVVKAITFMEKAEQNAEIKIVFIDSLFFKKAQGAFLNFSEHKISFTDAVSYVLCKEFKIDEIFTLDADFKKMRLNTSF